MERKNAWEKYTNEELELVNAFAEDYCRFLSACKTERECVEEFQKQAEAAGFADLEEVIREGRTLKPGDRVYANNMGKGMALYIIGEQPIEEGMNILGAHIDSPRLDLKQNPLYEDNDMVLFETHYYGGVKKYQWVTLPLALHGVIAKKDGTVVKVCVGEDPSDPVFGVSDLLIHLSGAQLEKKAARVIEGEDMNVLIGSRPLPKKSEETFDAAAGAACAGTAAEDGETGAACAGTAAKGPEAGAASAGNTTEGGSAPEASEKTGSTGATEKAEKEKFSANILRILKETYGIEEEDFLSAEIEVVPAGPARDYGFDRSMIMGYGQDDRVCAYPSFIAMLAVDVPKRTSVCLLVDKEEIGSVGATGMESRFFENTTAEVMHACGSYSELALRRALRRSKALSSDVSAAFDPNYPLVMEKKNSAYFGRGLVFNKYTGSRGKSGSNDANAEYVAQVRAVMDNANVYFQTAELGKVDAGGGGTIAYILGNLNMQVIDSGVAVLNMHSPWEICSKADLYEAKCGYEAFLLNA